MTWTWALVAPFPVQGVAMLFDELHFHRARGLPRWERIGHPLDTLTMLACVGWALVARPSGGAIAVYAALAIVSCLFVTKDEFVHARRCSPGEHWLHALLFVVHPLILVSAGILWVASHPEPGAIHDLVPDGVAASRILVVQFALTAAFCLYQTTYWNLPWIRSRPSAR